MTRANTGEAPEPAVVPADGIVGLAQDLRSVTSSHEELTKLLAVRLELVRSCERAKLCPSSRNCPGELPLFAALPSKC